MMEKVKEYELKDGNKDMECDRASIAASCVSLNFDVFGRDKPKALKVNQKELVDIQSMCYLNHKREWTEFILSDVL